MSSNTREFCTAECRRQCQNDTTCNNECLEYCMRQNNSNSGIFGTLFSGWGISAMICCCVLLIASCFFFMKGKSSTPKTNTNAYNPFYSMNSPTPGFGTAPVPSFNPASVPSFNPAFNSGPGFGTAYSPVPTAPPYGQ